MQVEGLLFSYCYRQLVRRLLVWVSHKHASLSFRDDERRTN